MAADQAAEHAARQQYRHIRGERHIAKGNRDSHRAGHAVASITLIEVYGCKDLASEEQQALDTVFANFTVYNLDREIIDKAIQLRQERRMKLGDSIIAATVLYHGQRLATNNTADFAGIPGLELFNPMLS